MTMKTSSERFAAAMERTRRQWDQQIKAGAAAAATANLDQFLTALKVAEDDHRLVLEKVQALRKALSYLREPGRGQPRRVMTVLHDLNDFLGTRLARHLEDEERTLFPFLERSLPDGKALVAQLKREHAAILDKRDELAACLEVASNLTDDTLPHTVMLDLVTYGLELWDRLDAHAHTETQAIRQCLLCRWPR